MKVKLTIVPPTMLAISALRYPNLEAVERFAADSSRTTHGPEECIDACRLFARTICRALLGCSKDEVLLGDADSFVGGERVTAIARGSYSSKSEKEIQGTGYVVQSLEAALWVFARTRNFADAILMAANFGDDADTTAAVCGQVAGASYGESGIPTRLANQLSANKI